MKGTAILYQPDQNIRFIEDIEKEKFDELLKQCGGPKCTNHLNGQLVGFGQISPMLWHEEDVDWDYGY
ncbi:hypothetical protein [Litchfieldia alkalitelluris]|uniref:hypothetical protein n=1 Tax=Litchfieldia alkalitelluris TaxID=304268 RepID=UPI000998793D|nr:hypothetical protein [Litchfieldia alkalitelluris]